MRRDRTHLVGAARIAAAVAAGLLALAAIGWLFWWVDPEAWL